MWVSLVVHVTLIAGAQAGDRQGAVGVDVSTGENCVLPVLSTKSTTETDVMSTCVSLVSPSTKFTPGSAAVLKAEILTVTGPTPGFVWLTVKDAVVASNDVLEVDVGFDIGLVLVQIGHEEVRVRARDVGDECTLIGVDLVAVDAEGGGAAGLTDIEHVLGVYVPALGLIQWILPDHHDLGGVRIAEGHEEVAAGWRPGEAEV